MMHVPECNKHFINISSYIHNHIIIIVISCEKAKDGKKYLFIFLVLYEN